MAQPAAGTQVRPFTNGMRSPIVAPLTRGLLGVPLFLLTTHTDQFFAWTIKVPLTAAVLGANYWSSAALAILASRERAWADGRISISVALVFAPVTTAATFIHFGLFHTDSFFGWFWIVAYAIYPPMLLFLLYRQLRVPGGDPPRTSPLPPWVRATFAAHAAVLVPLGVVMFVAPGAAGHLWLWWCCTRSRWHGSVPTCSGGRPARGCTWRSWPAALPSGGSGSSGAEGT